jgi:hypothetical protein
MSKILRHGLALAGLTVLLAGPTAAAAAMTFEIPFGFIVNGKELPPGSYNCSTSGRSVLFVSGFGGSAFASTDLALSPGSSDAKLVFHRYGDEHFLRETWMGSDRVWKILLSRDERERIRSAQSGANSGHEVVSVRAR